MTADTPVEPLSEEARRGRAVLEAVVLPKLSPDDAGKFVAIDLDTQDYEVDSDDYTAARRLRARQPAARMWLFRAGDEATYLLRRSVAGGA
jgi:hypothetical protein